MSEEAQTLSPTLPVTKKIIYWLPTLLWMAAIFIFSTDIFSSGNTGGLVLKIAHWIFPNLTEDQYLEIHYGVRKLGHFSVYAILSFWLFYGFRAGSMLRWKRQWGLYTFLIVGIYALLDEYHQTFVSSRTGSIYDSLIDLSGGVFMLLVLWTLSLRKSSDVQKPASEK